MVKKSSYDLLNLKEIYIISDIHSNLPALQSVLCEIPVGSVIICAGDIVGYYTEPNEVCELLRSRKVICIKGNHDKYVLGELYCKRERKNIYRVLETQKELSEDNRDWLVNLDDELSFHCISENHEAYVLSVHHGSRDNCEEYIYPDNNLNWLNDDQKNILVLGHTHHPMMLKKFNTLVLNPGSVGQPRDRKPGASYAKFRIADRSITFYRANYDIKKYQSKLDLLGVEAAVINYLSRV